MAASLPITAAHSQKTVDAKSDLESKQNGTHLLPACINSARMSRAGQQSGTETGALL